MIKRRLSFLGGGQKRIGENNQSFVSDELRNLYGVLEAFIVSALLDPGVDLEIAWRPVEGAVDRRSAEILGVVVEPLSFLIGQLDRIERAYPIVIGPAATAHKDRHVKI